MQTVIRVGPKGGKIVRTWVDSKGHRRAEYAKPETASGGRPALADRPAAFADDKRIAYDAGRQSTGGVRATNAATAPQSHASGPRPPFDVRGFLALLEPAAARHGYTLHRIGEDPDAQAAPMWIVRPPAGVETAPPRLVMAGIHGDEPAGAWAILACLAKNPPGTLRGVNATFVPMFNEAGLQAGTAEGADGHDPNEGLRHGGTPSAEGRTLVVNRDEFEGWAAAGVLSLHCDGAAPGCYVYALEARADDEGSVSRRVLDAMAAVFPRHTGPAKYGNTASRGLVVEPKTQGSPEEFLYRRGVPVALKAEVPGKAPMAQKVEASSRAIRAFLLGGER